MVFPRSIPIRVVFAPDMDKFKWFSEYEAWSNNENNQNIYNAYLFGNMTRLKCFEVEYCNFWNEGGWDETNNTHNIRQIPLNMCK